jgi:hypothetical protein
MHPSRPRTTPLTSSRKFIYFIVRHAYMKKKLSTVSSTEFCITSRVALISDICDAVSRLVETAQIQTLLVSVETRGGYKRDMS